MISSSSLIVLVLCWFLLEILDGRQQEIFMDRQTGPNEYWRDLFYATNVSSDRNSTLWMDFANLKVEIFPHLNNRGMVGPINVSEMQFFHSPLALVHHRRVQTTSYFHPPSSQYAVNFTVIISNNIFRNLVARYMSRKLGQTVTARQVRVLSYDKVFLASFKPTIGFQVVPTWKDPADNVTFTLTCPAKSKCDQLAQELHNKPQVLINLFRLRYSLSNRISLEEPTNSARKEVIIRTREHALQTDLMMTILEETKLYPTQQVLLTDEYLEILTAQGLSIILDRFFTLDMILDDPSMIQSIIARQLLPNRTMETVSELNDIKWNLVYWYDDTFRPDNVAKTFNRLYQELPNESKQKFVDSFEKETLLLPDAALRELPNDITIQENRLFVRFINGQFVPKPLNVSRMDLIRLRKDAMDRYEEEIVNVSYTTSDLTRHLNLMVELKEGESLDQWLTHHYNKADLQHQKEHEAQIALEIIKQHHEEKLKIQKLKEECKRNLTQLDTKLTSMILDFKERIIRYSDTFVAFHAQRKGAYSLTARPIPYDVAPLNTKGLLDVGTGLFNARVPGLYYFFFSSLKESKMDSGGVSRTTVELRINGATAIAENSVQMEDPKSLLPIVLQATVHLDPNDHVGAYLTEGLIHDVSDSYDTDNYLTIFTGFLLQPDSIITTSLNESYVTDPQ